jgi:hypothetical protein
MPTYVYEHDKHIKQCGIGREFEIEQPLTAPALTKCPDCGHPVHRLICPPLGIRTPRSNSDLRSLGFTKLVRRDKGIYENVTASNGESRIVEAGKPGTMPHLRKKIRD